MTELKPQLLLIEANPAFQRVIKFLLKDTVFHLNIASNFEEALQKLKQSNLEAHPISLVLLNTQLPDSPAIFSIKTLNQNFDQLAIIVIHEREDEVLARECLKNGAQDFYPKGQLEKELLKRAVFYSLERKQVETELREAKIAAEAASLAKEEFLNKISHELRTPLNGISGMSLLLEPILLKAGHKEYIKILQNSAEQLTLLIEDILDFSRLNESSLKLQEVEFDLVKNVGEVVKNLEVKAQNKGLRLSTQLDPEMPAFLIGDPVRLNQILINLIENSIKFSQEGEIILSIEKMAQFSSTLLLKFTVRDQGLGIAPERQKAIFEGFSQGDNSCSRNFGGLGLGLSIAAQLIRLMHGKIWIESEIQQGTQVHFTIRLGIAQRD